MSAVQTHLIKFLLKLPILFTHMQAQSIM